MAQGEKLYGTRDTEHDIIFNVSCLTMKKHWKPVRPPGYDYKQENLAEIRKAARFLYQIGEIPELRQPSPPLNPALITTPDFQAKITYVKQSLRRYTRITRGKGKGLAAIQVGIHERFFVVYMDPENKTIGVFINPVIAEASATQYRYNEACMSANSLVAPVVRPAWIRFSYLDDTGKHKVWETKDTSEHTRMLNRVIQHEIDHLDGVINIDRVKSVDLEFESFPNPEGSPFEVVTKQEQTYEKK